MLYMDTHIIYISPQSWRSKQENKREMSATDAITMLETIITSNEHANHQT